MDNYKASKCLKGIVASISLLTVSAANAEYNYFETHGYQDELKTCIDVLRSNLDLRDDDVVSYEVEKIDLRGPWYRFDIVTTVTDGAGQERLGEFEIGCKSNRWIVSARLIERVNNPSSYQPITVHNTHELAVQTDALALNTGEQ